MTEIPTQELVKCPMLFEHEPCDLSPAHLCKKCNYFRLAIEGVVECRYDEVKR